MVVEDLCQVTSPRLSVITPSLNHARFLRETIETIAAQTFRSFEHIVIDGGSTDGTVEILQSYPHVRWISEKDRDIVDAYQKAIARVRGEYVIQCCVSDGFHDRRWFERAVGCLDADPELSLVWALPQYMTESGILQAVAYADFLEDPPPQKRDFLSFWWATRMPFPESNYCVRADVLRRLFPTADSPEHFRIHPHLGFMHDFMVGGYLPWFLPEVVSFGRLHADQRGKRLWHIERPAQLRYNADVDDHRRAVTAGRRAMVFRDGSAREIGTLSRADAKRLGAAFRWTRWSRSPLLRRPLYLLLRRIAQKLGVGASGGGER
ncbi:MAG: glycosyltransferase [Betaproteobacteria bacterium]|nr:glycosyltransferase [Betaproteobacteria bacterium]